MSNHGSNHAGSLARKQSRNHATTQKACKEAITQAITAITRPSITSVCVPKNTRREWDCGEEEDEMSREREKGRGRIVRFRPDHFITEDGNSLLSDAQHADDLEEAIRIALRKSALDPDTFRYRHKWHFHAPAGWRVQAECAPPAVVAKARDDLAWADAMQREDEARCERITSLLLDAMRSDVFVAARLIDQIEAEYEEGSIPRQAVERFREESCA